MLGFGFFLSDCEVWVASSSLCVYVCILDATVAEMGILCSSL